MLNKMFDSMSSSSLSSTMPSPSPTHRPEPRSTKRAEIETTVIQATEELLYEGSTYAELNIERITSRAGISRTAFYFYFKDKRELLMRVSEVISETLYQEANGWWSGADNGADQLTAALRQIGALYRQHGALLRAIVEVSTYDEVIGSYWRELVGKFVEATQARIETDQKTGKIDPEISAKETAFALTWMTERTFYELMVQGTDTEAINQTIEALVGIWLRSVYRQA